MKIVFHCVYYPPEIGGLESHVAYLARELAAGGHEVAVVTSKSRPGLPGEERLEGVRVVRTPLPGRHAAGWAVHAVGSVPALRREARGADLLHAQAFPSVLPCSIVARKRIPVVATFHTSHFLRLARNPLWKPILRRLVSWPAYALAASREIADVAEGLAPGRLVEPLTNGVETSFFRPGPGPHPADGTRRLVVPRRLFRKNGVEHLIRALPKIRSGVGPIRVRIVGDGPERPRLEALAEELGVVEEVEFLGARPHDEMPELLTWGELAIFPSLMEATSVAALEAMACGLPVAASRVGGLPEIVDESVGALFRPADPDDLARVVVALLQGGTLPRLGRQARGRVVERWSNRRLADRHLQIYEGILEAWKRKGP